MKMRELYKKHAEHAFRMSPDDAYELERSLRLFDRFPSARSGPGGGVDATPFTVGFFAIAVLIGGLRKDIGNRVWGYWRATPEDSVDVAWRGEAPAIVDCSFTGKHRFGDAVEAILASPTLSVSVLEIGVKREVEEAWIKYTYQDEERVSRFIDIGARRERHQVDSVGTLQTQARIGGAAIYSLAFDLARSEGGAQ